MRITISSGPLKGSSFSSRKQYLKVIGKISALIGKNVKGAASKYRKEINPIRSGHPLTEKTPWGGVSLKKVTLKHDYIRKLLVVSELGRLGFEYHRRKQGESQSTRRRVRCTIFKPQVKWMEKGRF